MSSKLIAAMLAAATLTGCPSGENKSAASAAPTTVAAATAAPANRTVSEASAKPKGAGGKISTEAKVSTPSGLKYTILKAGKGKVAKSGDEVTVNYTGWLPEGTKFDSSLDRNQPFSFALGQHRVIKGWEEGVAGMKVGEKRKLVIPSDLGYGAAGTPGGPIPPNATLIFDVELLDVKGK